MWKVHFYIYAKDLGQFKGAVKFILLRIDSAHTKRGSTRINIAQISYLSNFFSFETHGRVVSKGVGLNDGLVKFKNHFYGIDV